MDLLHSGTGILHGSKGLLVDVGGFDAVYLLLEHADLAFVLFKRVFMLLLSFERVPGNWRIGK